MEALTAASVAALTIYDMCKAIDRAMVVTDLRLLRKCGRQDPAITTADVDCSRVEEALARAHLAPLRQPCRPSRCSLADAVGRVLAEDVAARRTQPPFAVSAMDGYAVRAEDVARGADELRHGRRDPGRRPGSAAALGPGEAVRIFTGAPLPDGADAIVIQEDTERRRRPGRGLEGAPRGRYVRRAGLDFAEGDVLLRAGRRLTPRDVGLAAAMNRPWLLVHRRPRVAILSTGDEIVMPGDPIGPHQIVSSNALALVRLGAPPRAACRCWSATPATTRDALRRDRGGGARRRSVRDDRRRLGRRARSGARRAVGRGLGDRLLVDRDAARQAPDVRRHYRGTPMLGLPGNPVSTLVCSLVFLKPALDKLSGLPEGAEAAGDRRGSASR